MNHGRMIQAKPESSQAMPLAHWRFSPDHVTDGSLTGGDLVISDLSGNSNHLLLAAMNPEAGREASSVLSWVNGEEGYSLRFSNDGSERTEGYYFRTLEAAPLNADTLSNGYTIEAVIAMPDPFHEQKHSWMGVLTRQGQGADLGRRGEKELLATLSVSSCKEMQWVCHADNLDTSATNWSRYLREGEWLHVAIVNDTRRTLLYVNGICDYSSPAEPIRGIAALPGKGWSVGVSEWEGRPDKLFSGLMQEIRITGEPLHPNRWLRDSKPAEHWQGVYNGEAALTTDSCYHFAFVPDPQMQTYMNPEMVQAQGEWLAGQSRELNIAMTAFVGDMVHNRGAIAEWERASQAVMPLDRAEAPYMVTAGNHDYDDTDTYLRYFGPGRFSDKTYYRGHSASMYSSYAILPAGSYRYLWLMVDMKHLRQDLGWCREVLREHEGLPTILVSHDLIYASQQGAQRKPHQSANGLLVWQELVYPFNQVFMTVNGHYNGCVHQVRRNKAGNDVISLLVNYQDGYRGGNGWLRLAEVDEAANVISFRTYSPWVACLAEAEPLQYPDYLFLTGPFDQFQFPIMFKERFSFAY
ncbi:metallophosphoesterase [Paenibacillus sp. J5C_2022]|uniref:LamG-like jellyroll fold domain-containing protein n=1 Tax=Paenibacillus sp. J5C2022 TaxID=2977129 RepID=UPI0021D2F084|nr:LamG-like jellyroll fold domain-containing protein [Paenibacillus sp. J5C2022]MCU6708245.1 metallophosphoesterase [Paenibacillus sp. J5C2022]